MESDYSLPEAVDAAVAVASKLINLNEEIANDIKEFNSKYKRLEGFEKIYSRDVAKVGLQYYKNLLKIQDSVHRGLRDVGSGDDKRKIFTSENNDIIILGRSKPLTIIGVIFFISSILVAVIFSNNLWIPKFLIVLWLAACGWACLSRKKIKCACGFHGVPSVTSKRNGCIFFLLLCIGILPGLIYYIVKPKRIECPWCGSPMAAGSRYDKRKIFTSEKYDIVASRSKTSTIVGVMFFISSFVVAGIFCYNLWMPSFIIVILLAACGWTCLTRKQIKCACGYHGAPRITSERNNCIFFLLLCIGILPGLIYYIVKPKRIECPWCRSPLRIV